MAVTPSSALYYPTIDVPDEEWLRTASLFWDHIRTIVPESTKAPYSSRFANELADEGILFPVTVNSGMPEIRDLEDEVLGYLTDVDSQELMSWDEWAKKNPRSADKLNYLGLNRNKLPDIIRQQFLQMMDDDGFYRFEPDFSKYYMTLLATRLSQRLGLALVTSSAAADQLGLSVRKGRSTSAIMRQAGRNFDATGPRQNLPRELATGTLVDVAMNTISVRREINIKDLLRFRRDHAEELALFRSQIGKLASDISADVSIEALRQAARDQYNHHIKPALKSLKRSMSLQRWDVGLNGLLKVSLLSAGPASLAIYAGMPASLALLAGAGISVTASAVTILDQLRRAEESPYSYLIAAERLSRK